MAHGIIKGDWVKLKQRLEMERWNQSGRISYIIKSCSFSFNSCNVVSSIFALYNSSGSLTA